MGSTRALLTGPGVGWGGVGWVGLLWAYKLGGGRRGQGGGGYVKTVLSVNEKEMERQCLKRFWSLACWVVSLFADGQLSDLTGGWMG